MTTTLARSLVSTLVLSLLAFGMTPGAPGAIGAETATIQGDVNCDSTVSAVDSLEILRSTAGLGTSAACLADAGDVNCDDAANSVDSLRILRHVAGLTNTTPEGCVPIGEPLEEEVPATSEELIAAALAAGDITYDESLLYRAYALFSDPRLPAEYSSTVMDWEAGTELLGEIDDHEDEISSGVLADLEDFRVRPNDPASIHYDTPESVSIAPQGINRAWRTSLVPGTGARVWALGAPGAEQKYVSLVSTVWSHFLGVFAYPDPDLAGDPNAVVNPDNAIDFYFVNPGIDPRYPACQVPNPNPNSCVVASDYGMARRAAPFPANKSSGYLIVNAARIGADPLTDDNLVDTIAHELAHVSQYAYDKGETSWLYESTATWVAYRIMLDMGRTPRYAYGQAEKLYENLEKTLHRSNPPAPAAPDNDKYGSWLFFQHAAMVAGDGIVSQVWSEAAPAGQDGINAVDRAFALDENFDDFTVRNWNVKPPLIQRYKDAPDGTFPDSLKPELDRDLAVPGEADYTLNLPVEPLSARYYRYEFGSAVRHIIFENNLVQTDGAHVWLLKKIDGDWKPPEDMAGAPVQTWCRDLETGGQPLEDLEELIVIVSYSEISGPPLNHHHPRVIADQIACEDVTGWVSTTLHVSDGLQDITYTSGVVNLRFKPREIQDTPGNVQYDLSSQSAGVHWVASGTYGGCPAEGEATVLFPGVEYTGVEPAAGYLVVVGPGDNHSAIITAGDPAATLTVTCPGDPPTVSHAAFQAGLLLHVLGWPNSEDGTAYKGDCTLSFGDTTYHFTWNLRAPDVLEPLSQQNDAVGAVPECFEIPLLP